MSKPLIRLCTTVFVTVVFHCASAQICIQTAPVCVPSNGYAFRWANDVDFGLLFNVGTGRYEFTEGSGDAVVGISAFNGNIYIPGGGALQVDANRYAFQFTGNPNYGLFFNQTDSRYEFKDGGKSAILHIDANTGATVAASSITGQGSSFAGSFGVSGTSALKTSGYLGVQGSMDFGDVDSLDLPFFEIGVVGISSGSTVADNIGVLGYSNGVAVRAINSKNSHFVSLASASHGIEVTGPSLLSGAASIDGNLQVARSIGVGIPAINTFNSMFDIDVQASTGPANMQLQSAWGMATIMLDRGDTSSTSSLVFRTSGVNDWFMGTVGSRHFGIFQSTSAADGSLVITKGGTVGINNPNPNPIVDLHIGSVTGGGQLMVGSIEQWIDSGLAVFATNSTLIPTIDNFQDLGSSTQRWHEVWSSGGVVQISDRRSKKNIRNLQYGLEDILKLRPVSYELKDDPMRERTLGLIAQEVRPVIDEVVQTGNYKLLDERTGEAGWIENERMGMQYTALIPVLIKAVQEQNQIIQEKNKEIVRLRSDIQVLEDRMDRFERISTQLLSHKQAGVKKVEALTAEAWLSQNVPNPSEGITTVRYFVPDDANRAAIRILDVEGHEVKHFQLAKGFGQIDIQTTDLPSGPYLYSLTIDGRVSATRQMILSR